MGKAFFFSKTVCHIILQFGWLWYLEWSAMFWVVCWRNWSHSLKTKEVVIKRKMLLYTSLAILTHFLQGIHIARCFSFILQVVTLSSWGKLWVEGDTHIHTLDNPYTLWFLHEWNVLLSYLWLMCHLCEGSSYTYMFESMCKEEQCYKNSLLHDVSYSLTRIALVTHCQLCCVGFIC